MKEVNLENWFDENYEDIDVSENEKFETIGTTTKQIYESYEEYKQNLE